MVDVIDESNMHDMLTDLVHQVESGYQAGGELSFDKPSEVVITGMGGSALAGEILKSYFFKGKLRIRVNRSYVLPEDLSKDALVFVCSYSGNTDETIRAFQTGLRLGVNMVVLTKGGRLAELAKEHKKPLIKLTGLSDQTPPRLSYPFMFFAMLKILERSSAIPNQFDYVEKTIDVLGSRAMRDKGEELASRLLGKVPLIYTSDRLSAVGYKWKININENAKALAFNNVIPEMNHNELSGFMNFEPSTFFVVILKDEDDYSKIKLRMDAFKEVIKVQGVSVLEIAINGSCTLAKIFSSIALGDWTSYFLAVRYNTDPTPVDLIEEFKKRIS